MSDKNLYNLSNKIRTILLTTIDKEILICSKKNHLLINSQSQEQLTKKYVNYRDFTIESEESFKGEEDNENNNIFYDLRCNFSHNKLNFFFYSSRKNSQLTFPQNFTDSHFSLKKNKANSRIQKIENSKVPENNLCKLKNDLKKKSMPGIESSFSCKEILDLKNLILLSNDNKKKYLKKLSGDLKIYSTYTKTDECSNLINYCYKLKKPNNSIINEISDDDTPANKKKKKNYLITHRSKNNHKNIQNKKLKKVINKKRSVNKNNQNNNDKPFITPTKKNSTHFSNEMKIYLDCLEKLSPQEKIKIKPKEKELSNKDLKKIDMIHWKNILELHHCNSKSPENKSKSKKLEQTKKIFSMQVINKKPTHKKSQNFVTCFKSDNNSPIILKNKEKKEKREKKDVSNCLNAVNNNTLFKRQPSKSSKMLNNCEEFKKTEIFCEKKPILKNDVNKRNESTKNERKSINISNNNYKYKTIDPNESIGNNQNLNKF